MSIHQYKVSVLTMSCPVSISCSVTSRLNRLAESPLHVIDEVSPDEDDANALAVIHRGAYEADDGSEVNMTTFSN
jgi:hypothetical protein